MIRNATLIKLLRRNSKSEIFPEFLVIKVLFVESDFAGNYVLVIGCNCRRPTLVSLFNCPIIACELVGADEM